MPSKKNGKKSGAGASNGSGTAVQSSSANSTQERETVETQTIGAGDVGTIDASIVKERKPRKTAYTSDNLMAKYMEVQRSGGTYKELAEKTGLETNSLYVRVNQLRTFWKKKGKKLPDLKGSVHVPRINLDKYLSELPDLEEAIPTESTAETAQSA